MPRTIDYPLVAGVDESKNSKLQPGPRLLRAENLRIVDKEMVRKRRGTATFAGGAVDANSPTPIGPVRLASHNGQTLVFSEQSLWTVGAGGVRLEELDPLPNVTLESAVRLGHYPSANVVSSSCAQTTAFRVWTWATYNGTSYELHILTLDLTRKAGSAGTVVPLTTPTQALKCLKAIAIGAKVTVFWGEGTALIRYLDITSATQGPYTTTQGTTLVSDADQTEAQWFDVSPHSTGYCLVYRSSAGTPTYKVTRYSSAHASQATGTFTPTPNATGMRLGICGDSNQMCVAIGSTSTLQFSLRWYDNTITLTNQLDDSGTLTGSAQDVTNVGIAPYIGGASGDVVTWFNWTAASGPRTRMAVIEYSDPSDPIATEIMNGSQMASKPWVSRGDVYCLVRYYTSQANSFYAVTRMGTTIAQTRAAQYSMLCARFKDAGAPETVRDDGAACVAITSDVVHVPVASTERYSPVGVARDPTGVAAVDPNQDGATGTQNLSVVGLSGFEFSTVNRARWQCVQVGPYMCIGGGVVMAFDGRRATEIGFSSFPDITTANVVGANTASGAVALGTYAVGACWEFLDYLNNREQSAVKFLEGITVAGAGDTLVWQQITEIQHTLKQWRLEGDDGRRIGLGIYRNTLAQPGLMNRVESPSTVLFPTVDVTAGSTVLTTYNDIYAEGAISLVSREMVYATNFGFNELQHQMPPPSNVLCSHEARLFGVRADQPTVVWYTLQLDPGRRLCWNDSLVIQFDADVLALASQDGNLIGLCEQRIYTVVGRPADNSGAQTAYDPPQLLSGHIGLKRGAQRSVLTTPAGIFFQSVRGIELLPRGGGTPEHLGEMVYQTLEAFPVITAALHNAAASEVLFSCVTAETVGATGRVLAYDYDSDVWFIRSYGGGKPIVDMVMDGTDVVFGIYDSASALKLWKEDAGFDDADLSFVGTTLELGDLRLAKASGLQSFWSAVLLGEAVAPSKLLIEESADGGEYVFSEQYIFARSETDMTREYAVTERKARKHRLRLSEVTTGTADTAGVAYSRLTLAIEPAVGTARNAMHLRG